MPIASKTIAMPPTKVPPPTTGGLPLDHTPLITSPVSGARYSGPARHINCRSRQMMAMPSLHTSKRPSVESDDPRLKKLLRVELLRVGPVQNSLLDDDSDDELVDYFGIGGGANVPCFNASPPVSPTPSDDVIRLRSLWNVRDHNVRTLPSFYPLEKSSVFVPQASASTITVRIATVLQARAIVASYDAQNAKADCVSEFCVAFRIRLYRGRGEECRHGIIIEVQRRAGFDLSYARDVYAILDAVQGKSVNDHAEEDEPILCESANNASGSDEVIIGILEKPRMLASLKGTSGFVCPSGRGAKKVTTNSRQGKSLNDHAEEDEPIVFKETNIISILEKPRMLAPLQGISKTVCPSGWGAEKVTTNSRRLPKASVVSCTSMEFMRRVTVPVTNKRSASKKYFDLRRPAISNVGQSQDHPQNTTTKPLETLTNATLSQSSAQLAKPPSKHDDSDELHCVNSQAA